MNSIIELPPERTMLLGRWVQLAAVRDDRGLKRIWEYEFYDHANELIAVFKNVEALSEWTREWYPPRTVKLKFANEEDALIFALKWVV